MSIPSIRTRQQAGLRRRPRPGQGAGLRNHQKWEVEAERPALRQHPSGRGPQLPDTPSGKFAYVNLEMTSGFRLLSRLQEGALKDSDGFDFAEEGKPATARRRCGSSLGKFVYCSNRGHDSIAVFAVDNKTGKLTFVEREPTGGGTPATALIPPVPTCLPPTRIPAAPLSSVNAETGD